MSNDDRNLLDLTTQMSAWRSAGNDLWTADQLRLEAGAATRFIGNIDAALDTLRSQLAGAQGLQSWLANADVGQFVSATTTRGHLQQDITEFLEAVNKYANYLQALKTATAGAARLITTADQPR